MWQLIHNGEIEEISDWLRGIYISHFARTLFSFCYFFNYILFLLSVFSAPSFFICHFLTFSFDFILC